MKELVLHPLTRQQIEAFSSTPSHALLLVGQNGIGKDVLASKLAASALQLSTNELDNYPYKLVVASEDGRAIGIDRIRELEHFLSLKVPRKTDYNRAIIIEQAQLLTPEAQNALLKILEEPPSNSLLILTTNHAQALLPTINSRLQKITIKKPSKPDLEDFFSKQNYDAKAISQTYAISGGLPGLMQALLGRKDHPLLQATAQARSLLNKSLYDRLLMVEELAKQRDLAADVAFILQQMAHVSLQTAKGEAAQKWQTILMASYQAAEALAVNAQPKLVLTNLMLSLRQPAIIAN